MYRRSLIQCGLLQGLGLPSLARAAPDNASDVCDVVIIGAGISGLTAAALLAQAGINRVVVLESEPTIGGTSLISGGFWAVSETDLQKQFNVADSDEVFEEDIFRVGRHANRPDVVQAFIRHNREQYEWVRTTLGVEPRALVPGAGVRRSHAFDPRQLIAALYRYVTAKGIAVLTNRCAAELLLESGRVVGCRAMHQNRPSIFRARLGTLVATGGFSRNRALLAAFSPRMQFVSTIVHQGSRGDGLNMMRALGAGLADIEYLEASYAFTLNPTTINDMSLLPYYGGIVVNLHSKRFVDESLPYKQLASAVIAQPSGKSWIVFDERIRRIALGQKLDRRLWAPISEGRTPPYVHQGKTLKEVAAKAGLDPIELQRTVDKYNEDIRAGAKPRGPISVGSGDLMPIASRPFFIMPATVCLLGTYGGVAVNGRAQVLDVQGKPIAGLYAAGEVTGGLHGASFIMGTAFGKANTFGRIAALSLLEDLS